MKRKNIYTLLSILSIGLSATIYFNAKSLRQVRTSANENDRGTYKKMAKKSFGMKESNLQHLSTNIIQALLYPDNMSERERQKNNLIKNYINACCPAADFPRRVREISYTDCDGQAQNLLCADFDPETYEANNQVQSIDGPDIDERKCEEATDAYVNFILSDGKKTASIGDLDLIQSANAQFGSQSKKISRKKSTSKKVSRRKISAKKTSRKNRSRKQKKRRSLTGKDSTRSVSQIGRGKIQSRNSIINGLRQWCASGMSEAPADDVSALNFSQLLSSGTEENTQAGAYYPCEYLQTIIDRFSGSSQNCNDPFRITASRDDFLKHSGFDNAWDIIPGDNEEYDPPGLYIVPLDRSEINMENFPEDLSSLFPREESRVDPLVEATKVVPKIRMEIPGNFPRFLFRHAGVEGTLQSIADGLSEQSTEGVRVNPDFNSPRPNIRVNPIRINQFLEELFNFVAENLPDVNISHRLEGDDISGGLSIYGVEYTHNLFTAKWIGNEDGDRIRIMPRDGKVLSFRFLDEPNYFKYIPLTSPNGLNDIVPNQNADEKTYNPLGNVHALDRGGLLTGLNRAQCEIIRDRTSADLPGGVDELDSYNNIHSTMFRPFSCDCSYEGEINYCVYDLVKKHQGLNFKFLNYHLNVVSLVFNITLPSGEVRRMTFPKVFGSSTRGSLLQLDPFTGEGNINQIFSIKDLVNQKNMETFASALGVSPEFLIENLDKFPEVAEFYGDDSILASIKKVNVYEKEINVGPEFAGAALIGAISGDLEIARDESGISIGTQEILGSFMELLMRMQASENNPEVGAMLESVLELYAHWQRDPIINRVYERGKSPAVRSFLFGLDNDKPATERLYLPKWDSHFSRSETSTTIRANDVDELVNLNTRERHFQILCTAFDGQPVLSLIEPNVPDFVMRVSTQNDFQNLLAVEANAREFNMMKSNLLAYHQYINCGANPDGTNAINLDFKDSREGIPGDRGNLPGEVRSFYGNGLGLQLMTNMDLGAYMVNLYSPSFSESAVPDITDFMSFGALYIESPALMDWTRKFEKWYGRIFGWICRIIFKLLEWMINAIINTVFFLAGVIVGNNALLVDFDKTYLGVDSVIYPKSVEDPNHEDSYFKELFVKGRRVNMSYPHMRDDVTNLTTVQPFQNCRDFGNAVTSQRISGPRDFFDAAWSLLKCVVLDPILAALDVVTLPIRAFFSSLPMIIYDFLTWGESGFVAREIQASVSEYERDNNLLLMINGVLNQVTIPSTALFTSEGPSMAAIENQASEQVLNTEQQIDRVRSNPAVMGPLSFICNPSMQGYDPDNPGCLVYNLLNIRPEVSLDEYGNDEVVQGEIKVCLNRMGAKTHHESLKDLAFDGRSLSDDFPSLRYCVQGEYYNEYDQKVMEARGSNIPYDGVVAENAYPIRNIVDIVNYRPNTNTLLKNYEDIRGQNLPEYSDFSGARPTYRNQCAMFMDLEFIGSKYISYKEVKQDQNGIGIENNISLKLLIQPTDRTQRYLNDIFFCTHNATCDLSEKEEFIVHRGVSYPSFKGRSLAAACSMLADTWLLVDKENADGAHPEENANFACSFLDILSGATPECDIVRPEGRHVEVMEKMCQEMGFDEPPINDRNFPGIDPELEEELANRAQEELDQRRAGNEEEVRDTQEVVCDDFEKLKEKILEYRSKVSKCLSYGFINQEVLRVRDHLNLDEDHLNRTSCPR